MAPQGRAPQEQGQDARAEMGTGVPGDHSGVWELQCSCCRRKGKGQPTLGAAWWEFQELLDAEELPIPHWCGAGPTALLRAQAVPGTVFATHGPILVGIAHLGTFQGLGSQMVARGGHQD